MAVEEGDDEDEFVDAQDEPEKEKEEVEPVRVPAGSKWARPLSLNSQPKSTEKASPQPQSKSTTEAAPTKDEEQASKEEEEEPDDAEEFAEAEECGDDTEIFEEGEEEAESENDEVCEEPRQRVVRVDSAPEEADEDEAEEDDTAADCVAKQGKIIGDAACDRTSEDLETADSSGNGIKGDAERSDEEHSEVASSTVGSMPSGSAVAVTADSESEAGRAAASSSRSSLAAQSLRPNSGNKTGGKLSLLSGGHGYLGPRSQTSGPTPPNKEAVVMTIEEVLRWRLASDDESRSNHCVAMVYEAPAVPSTPSRGGKGSKGDGKGSQRDSQLRKNGSGVGFRGSRGRNDRGSEDFEREPMPTLEAWRICYNCCIVVLFVVLLPLPTPTHAPSCSYSYSYFCSYFYSYSYSSYHS